MSQESANSTSHEIDVRSLIPAQRHEKIFQLVDELAPGASFVLVNDHDPKPLYYTAGYIRRRSVIDFGQQPLPRALHRSGD